MKNINAQFLCGAAGGMCTVLAALLLWHGAFLAAILLASFAALACGVSAKLETPDWVR